MVAVTADLVRNSNNYDIGAISDTDLEYLIDECIRWVNLMAGQSMSTMTGVAGAKTVTLTDNQYAVLGMLIPLRVKARLERGAGGGVGSLSMGAVTSDPETGQLKPMVRMALQMLRGRSFERV